MDQIRPKEHLNQARYMLPRSLELLHAEIGLFIERAGDKLVYTNELSNVFRRLGESEILSDIANERDARVLLGSLTSNCKMLLDGLNYTGALEDLGYNHDRLRKLLDEKLHVPESHAA
jgi:hypothetical protein